ncbi:hypothetical protein BDW74DRAFT_158299 [Aspergillus multicolor]|uniref:uncharacterized protein n=1 Tax=Aspergillus multicolor TaxID=41759 RepID=UPI003CCE19A3
MIALALLAPLLAGRTTAASEPVSLLERADANNAFLPVTTEGCPPDWPTCGTSGICYNPAEGQTCCPGGTYACPSSTFCLLDPYCCPNDLTPEACADEYGLTLVPTRPPSEPTAFHPPRPSETESETDSESETFGNGHPRPTGHPTSSDSANSSITLSPTPIPTSSVVLWPTSLSLVPTGSPSAEEEPAYTGAGWSWRVQGGGLGVVAGALGAVVMGLSILL